MGMSASAATRLIQQLQSQSNALLHAQPTASKLAAAVI
jgi:hypothetical protein